MGTKTGHIIEKSNVCPGIQGEKDRERERDRNSIFGSTIFKNTVYKINKRH